MRHRKVGHESTTVDAEDSEGDEGGDNTLLNLLSPSGRTETLGAMVTKDKRVEEERARKPRE